MKTKSLKAKFIIIYSVVLVVILLIFVFLVFFIKFTDCQDCHSSIFHSLNINKEWILGDPNAKITVEMYEDFQAPSSKIFEEEILPKLIDEYKNEKVKFVYRHFPIFANSAEAAMAAEVAGSQGKFWEFHDRLFQNQNKLPYNLTTFLSIAKDIGLNTTSFEVDYISNKYKGDVDYDKKAGEVLQIISVPSIFVNGVSAQVGADQKKSIEDAINSSLVETNAGKKWRVLANVVSVIFSQFQSAEQIHFYEQTVYCAIISSNIYPD